MVSCCQLDYMGEKKQTLESNAPGLSEGWSAWTGKQAALMSLSLYFSFLKRFSHEQRAVSSLLSLPFIKLLTLCGIDRSAVVSVSQVRYSNLPIFFLSELVCTCFCAFTCAGAMSCHSSSKGARAFSENARTREPSINRLPVCLG